MKPSSHFIEIEVPEVEVSIDVTPAGQPYDEVNVRPSDEAVKRAVEYLIKRNFDELVDYCTDEHASECEEAQAVNKADRMELDRYYDERRYG